ncbi:lysosomal acid glucosylceramidase-like [Mercenaria mercenaria]|uniref:lysosomal acid glucosylceramidase-like n=1 Tax=Mercenaria mercenaria TaxID=6596 RepID=UPI00234EE5DA|nr:lysosomal acid glucosylceramidase-like [Mercenaria mercenaria]
MACAILESILTLLALSACLDKVTAESGILPCVPKTFGSSSVVCVCNSTYCDTVETEDVLPPDRFAVYVTTKSGSRLKKTVLHRQKFTGEQIAADASKSVLIFKVDTSHVRQTIVGFGGTFTDASGMNIASLSKSAQEHLINSYFGPDGIEYTLGRIPIASNDMSTDIYSYDFTNGDTGLSKFTIAGYDHLYKLPYIDQAVVASRRNVSLFGSPWSSPDWMKTNDNMVGYGTIADGMAKVYANYLGRFLQEYESFMFHGRMWGITPQSGPVRSCNISSQPQYQSLCWTAENMSDWVVRDLKPSLREYGYDHVKLLVMDDNRDQLPHWTEAFQSVAKRNDIDGFAVQSHHDGSSSPSLLADTHAKFPDKIIIGSEFSLHRKPAVDLGSWERAETLASSIFQDLQNFVSGYTHYNLALNASGGPSWINNNADCPIIVDATNKVFYKQPMFYIMGHFSKFVPPGSVAIGLKSDGPISVATPAVAFLRPDGSIAVIMANMSEEEVKIQLVDGTFVIKYTLEPSSIQTLVWWS